MANIWDNIKLNGAYKDGDVYKVYYNGKIIGTYKDYNYAVNMFNSYKEQRIKQDEKDAKAKTKQAEQTAKETKKQEDKDAEYAAYLSNKQIAENKRKQEEANKPTTQQQKDFADTMYNLNRNTQFTTVAGEKEWKNDYNKAKSETQIKSNAVTDAAKARSEAGDKLLDKQKEINDYQNQLNTLLKQNTSTAESEEEIKSLIAKRDAAKAELEGLQTEYQEVAKNEKEAQSEFNKANKKLQKLELDEPARKEYEKKLKEIKKQEKVAAKAAAKKENNTKKIAENIDKCDDPKENIHKTICIKAGILPSTPYAVKFCQWLKTQEQNWYILDENNNSKIDTKALKKLKSIYTHERAEKKAAEKEKKDAEKAAEKEAKMVKKAEKAAQKEADKAAKGLKQWRQAYYDKQHEEVGSDIIHVVPDDVDEGELQLLGAAVIEESKKFEKQYHRAPESDDDINTVYQTVWNKKDDIIGIKTKLSKNVIEDAEDPELKPNATEEFMNGNNSNTFSLSDAGVSIPTAVDNATRMTLICTSTTAAALEKLNEKVVNKLQTSIMKITDISEIVNIPVMAAADVAKHIMTADQVMQRIKDDLNDDKKTQDDEKSTKKNMDDKIDNVNKKAAQVKKTVADRITTFSNKLGEITNTLNQSGEWYISQANRLERQYEQMICKEIDAVTEEVLSGKQQFVDFMVWQVAYNLAAPINNALEKAQIFIIRQIEFLAKQAQTVAKALAAKAIMKILGLLGA